MQTDALKIAMAAAWADLARVVSLHTGDPGTTGANECTHTGYTRATPAAATAGATPGEITTGAADFTVEAGLTVAYIGLWTLDNEFLQSFPHAETFAAAGTAEVTVTFTYAEGA